MEKIQIFTFVKQVKKELCAQLVGIDVVQLTSINQDDTYDTIHITGEEHADNLRSLPFVHWVENGDNLTVVRLKKGFSASLYKSEAPDKVVVNISKLVEESSMTTSSRTFWSK